MKKILSIVCLICLTAVSFNANSQKKLDDSWRYLLRKALTNVTKTYTGGGYHIGDEYPGSIVIEYWSNNSLYCGGQSNGNNNPVIGMIIVDEGYQITNCPGGYIYSGQLVNGQKNGTGIVYDRYGKLIYMGDFRNDKPVEPYPDTEHDYTGVKFIVEFVGTGDMYVGETIGGVRDGLGLYFWESGSVWFGFWKNDTRNGAGIFKQYDGEYYTGKWANGKYIDQ
ncbi:MAG: hypothetical protein K6D59_00785 [Bacteroidales bacterium]|nr:hypothetical protein [Bacteroidales bacterium]